MSQLTERPDPAPEGPPDPALPRPEPGEIILTALDGKWSGWFSVHIGRGRYTKRFNLSAAELAQLLSLGEEALGRGITIRHRKT